MNKKLVSVLSICLIALIIIAVALNIAKQKDDDNLSSNSSGVIQNEGTNQSELETEVEEPVTSENVIVEKAEADYERWLAAGMVIGISLQYPEFDFKEIYLASETELGNSDGSKGAYVLFECEGEETGIYSRPLKEERTEAGTKDLYTEDLGFATFDEINPETIDKDKCVVVDMEELTELINQSILVTVYEH